MTTEKQRVAFLAAIAAEPLAYELRYIFADWLDEHDEPEEAARQRAFEAADRWMRSFAEQCGQTAENYASPEASEAYRQATADLRWDNPAHREALEAAGEALHRAEGYRDITYDEVVNAGIAHVEGDGRWWSGFTQQGSSAARDMMYDGDTKATYWKSWSIITGRPLPPNEDEEYGMPSPFSCSC